VYRSDPGSCAGEPAVVRVVAQRTPPGTR